MGHALKMKKLLARVLLSFAWQTSAWAAIALDGNAVGTNASNITTVTTGGLTTTNASDIVAMCVHNEAVNGSGAYKTVSTITGGGLTWSRRNIVQLLGGSGTAYNTMELWTAKTAGTLSSQAFTVTFSASTEAASIVVWGISGANTSLPFDNTLANPLTNGVVANPSLGAGFNNSLTTASSAAMVIQCIGTSNLYAQTAGTINGASATLIQTTNINASTNSSSNAAQYYIPAGTITSASALFSTNESGFVSIAEAFCASGQTNCVSGTSTPRKSTLMLLGVGLIGQPRDVPFWARK